MKMATLQFDIIVTVVTIKNENKNDWINKKDKIKMKEHLKHDVRHPSIQDRYCSQK